ncbi:related to quinate transport protein [Phialocephala subalpina]|uniref:Related to quinate transport protein n=1 Tax=Phialocephala subalpina TaxID=576137 RepID=A0A1L7XPP9_9HELO|nr:related to quinate transport protein [Phialocephala subalpina]
MASGQNLQGVTALMRAEMGNTGVKGLMKNKKVFFIAMFASFGGLLYGYQQGVLGQAVVMNSFIRDFPEVHKSASKLGWLTSVLQLGGWVGSLSAGVFGEVFSRKHTMFAGALWVVLGSFLSAGAQSTSYLYAGRLFTGLGVGTLSAIGPLYNAELSPPEMRGFLIALQQLTTTIGIMLAYWCAFGSNYIGGTGDGQSAMAWRLPMIIQGIPAVILCVGLFFMPYSPRLLVNKGKHQEALKTLAYLRNLPEDHYLVQVEFLEIKSDAEFEREIFDKRFPALSKATGNSVWRREFAQYSNIFRSKDNFKRVALASLVMFFQQWTGIDSIIYYASVIFQSLGLTSSTISLLASGVIGIINVATTIPAIYVIDRVGRKPLMMTGSAGMAICELIIGVIVATCGHDWASHSAAGWAAVVFVWLYIVNFAYSWGPGSWILIAEIFPISIRAKGTSIGASANWMNNFVIAFVVPPMLSGIGWGTYVFFAVWSAAGGVFIYFFMPETKGKTLEEMDQVFGSHTATEELEAFARVQERVGLTALIASRAGGVGASDGSSMDKEGNVGVQHMDKV